MITIVGIGIAYVTIINWRIHMNQYIGNQDFCGHPVVRSLPANAEDTGSNPSLISYLPRGQLSLCATTSKPTLWSPQAATTEPMYQNHWSLHAPEPVLHNKRSHCSEKLAQLKEE